MNKENYYRDVDNESIGNVSEERAVYIRTFINFVHGNTQLYVKKNKGYSKSQDKSLAWECIGAAMNPALTSLQAEKLFHRLREKFGKERKKVKMSMPRSGAGTGTPTYQSTWIFYNDLLFLADYIIARQTTSNFQRPAIQPRSSAVQSQSLSVQDKQSSHVSLGDKQSSPLSPLWNTDLNCLCSSPSSSLDSDISNTTGTNISCGTKAKECTIEEASGTASAALLKTMAASIQPAKTVPPNDPVKKRKRVSEKTYDVLSQSSKDVSFLATSLSSALDRFGSSRPVQSEPRAGNLNVSSDIEAMLGFIAVALNRVPEDERLSCVMDMVTLAKDYAENHSDYE